MATYNAEYRDLLRLALELSNDAKGDKRQMPAERIETLREVESRLLNYRRAFDPREASLDDGVILAYVYILLAKIYRADDRNTERMFIAKEHLVQCVQLLEGKELERNVVLAALRGYYELSCLSMNLKDLEAYKQFTRKTLELYWTYTERKDDYPAPIFILVAVGIVQSHIPGDEMDVMYAYSLQSLMLHQNFDLCSVVTNDELMVYVHEVLNKLRKSLPLPMSYIGWSRISAELGMFLAKLGRFREARHHLGAADFFIKKRRTEEELSRGDRDEESDQTHLQISVQLLVKWAMYGNTLLSSSRERLLRKDDKAEEEAAPQQSPRLLLFYDLEDELRDIVAEVDHEYVTNYKDAKAVFRRVLKWLDEAKKIAADGKFSEVQLDISRCIFAAYKNMSYYEREKNERIKLYKQRMDNLDDFAKTLSATSNPDSRKLVFLQLVLATYFLIDLKTEQLETLDAFDATLSTEIEQLIKYNIQNSDVYLNVNK